MAPSISIVPASEGLFTAMKPYLGSIAGQVSVSLFALILREIIRPIVAISFSVLNFRLENGILISTCHPFLSTVVLTSQNAFQLIFMNDGPPGPPPPPEASFEIV